MSLPEGTAIYLIAFSLFLSYIRKLTDQLATRMAYCFIYVNILYEHLFFLNLYLYLCFVFKNNV